MSWLETSSVYLHTYFIPFILCLDLWDADSAPVYVRVLFMSVEAGAGLSLVVFMMAMNVAVVDFDQISDQLQKGGLLFSRSCVSKLSRLVETANITNANTVTVMTKTVSTSLANEPTPLNGAIKTYDIMVPNILPSLPEWLGRGMVFFNFLSPDVNLFFGPGAVDDDFIYYSHI